MTAEPPVRHLRESLSFESLVRAHQDRVYDFCVRMLGDREEAFDLTQEIFVSVHAHFETFRGEAQVSTWLFRIARNHCLNRLKYLNRRGRGRSERLSDLNESLVTESLGGAVQPDALLMGKNLKALVHRAIAQLEEEQRSLVVLRDVEGLSYDEIVAITDLPEGTVKSRLHRAREKLAGILTTLEVGLTDEGE